VSHHYSETVRGCYMNVDNAVVPKPPIYRSRNRNIDVKSLNDSILEAESTCTFPIVMWIRRSTLRLIMNKRPRPVASILDVRGRWDRWSVLVNCFSRALRCRYAEVEVELINADPAFLWDVGWPLQFSYSPLYPHNDLNPMFVILPIPNP
jgi:hypothetical protein